MTALLFIPSSDFRHVRFCIILHRRESILYIPSVLFIFLFLIQLCRVPLFICCWRQGKDNFLSGKKKVKQSRAVEGKLSFSFPTYLPKDNNRYVNERLKNIAPKLFFERTDLLECNLTKAMYNNGLLLTSAGAGPKKKMLSYHFLHSVNDSGLNIRVDGSNWWSEKRMGGDSVKKIFLRKLLYTLGDTHASRRTFDVMNIEERSASFFSVGFVSFENSRLPSDFCWHFLRSSLPKKQAVALTIQLLPSKV